jgi:hypothetical protein
VSGAPSAPGRRTGSRAGLRIVGLMLAIAVTIAIVEAAYILNGIVQPPAISVAPLNSPALAIPEPESARTPPAGSATTVAPAITKMGRLLVRSEPSGAEVLLDGRGLGVTPVTLEDVPPGERQLLVRHAGAEVRQTVRIEAGGTVSVLAPFASQGVGSGYIALTTPIDLDVFEGGALRGTSRSPRIMFEAGVHELLLVNDELGFRQTHDVRVVGGRTAQIRIDVPQSTIHINARPWAEVSIDGKPVGETPIGNLPIAIGTHEIVFRHPQLGERTTRTTVYASTPARVAVDLSQPPSEW